MKKARITPSTFFLSFFITLWREQFVGNRGDTRRNARKSHRGKKTETFSPRVGVGANSL